MAEDSSRVQESRDAGHRPAAVSLGDGVELVVYILRRFELDRCLGMAAALSYASLLSVVPLAAIALGLLAAFPSFSGIRAEIRDAIAGMLLPSAGQAWQTYFAEFIENTGQLTAVGVVGLAVSALLLIRTIEDAINDIWRVRKPGPMVNRLLAYWAAITLGPLMLGTALSLSSSLYAATHWTGMGEAGPWRVVSRVLPLVLELGVASLIYTALPSRPVRRGDALAGAVVAVTLFEGLKGVFGLYVFSFPPYQTIYGTLAAVPLFLGWLYLSWTVVLLGAEVAAALPEWRAGARRPEAQQVSPGRKLGVSLVILQALLAAARQGRALPQEVLVHQSADRPDVMLTMLDRLRDCRFIDKSAAGRWILLRDLEETRLADLCRELELAVRPEDLDRLPAGLRLRLAPLIQRYREAEEQVAAPSLRRLLTNGD